MRLASQLSTEDLEAQRIDQVEIYFHDYVVSAYLAESGWSLCADTKLGALAP